MAFQPSANIKFNSPNTNSAIQKDMQLMKKVSNLRGELKTIYEQISTHSASSEARKMLFEAIKELTYSISQFEQDTRVY